MLSIKVTLSFILLLSFGMVLMYFEYSQETERLYQTKLIREKLSEQQEEIINLKNDMQMVLSKVTEKPRKPRKVLINYGHNCCVKSQQISCDAASKFGLECYKMRLKNISQEFQEKKTQTSYDNQKVEVIGYGNLTSL